MASVFARVGPAEITLKRSRFLAYAEKPRARRSTQWRGRARHPEAAHHCFACLIGESKGSARTGMNDDGEPSGGALSANTPESQSHAGRLQRFLDGAVVESVRYGESVVMSIRFDATCEKALIALCGANGLFFDRG